MDYEVARVLWQGVARLGNGSAALIFTLSEMEIRVLRNRGLNEAEE